MAGTSSSAAYAAQSQQQPQPESVLPHSSAIASIAAITYSKTFKGSIPEFVEITVHQNGSGTWDIRQLDENAAPQPFDINASLASEIFRLAALLHNFDGIDLDAQRRIAYLGQKTFRYEQGARKQEVTYNYTLNEDAAALQQIFEGLGREELDVQDLQRTMRYDHLGVNEVLRRIETDVNANAIPAPENLLPVLDQVSSDERYMEIARKHAQVLAQRLRAAHNAPAQGPS